MNGEAIVVVRVLISFPDKARQDEWVSQVSPHFCDRLQEPENLDFQTPLCRQKYFNLFNGLISLICQPRFAQFTASSTAPADKKPKQKKHKSIPNLSNSSAVNGLIHVSRPLCVCVCVWMRRPLWLFLKAMFLEGKRWCHASRSPGPHGAGGGICDSRLYIYGQDSHSCQLHNRQNTNVLQPCNASWGALRPRDVFVVRTICLSDPRSFHNNRKCYVAKMQHNFFGVRPAQPINTSTSVSH